MVSTFRAQSKRSTTSRANRQNQDCISAQPVPIRLFEPPEGIAGAEPSTLSTPIACEPKALISKASTAGQDRIRVQRQR